ncbi:MAG: cation:proton antiporter [Myxococcales bacterium]|nr:cation:proton antiporter [Myxococcales bacterium]MCB9752239.1 cation:proton antiporter [Myxococcales bacterium]
MSDPVSVFLVVIASLLLVGALGELLFARTRVPDVIWLIAAGLALRLMGVVPDSVLDTITPYFTALTLVIVLFEGGSRLSLADLTGAAPRATLMSLLGFLFAMITVAVFSMGLMAIAVLPSSWTFSHGMMLGAIVGGTSSLILTPALALARVSPRIQRIVQLEASLTDALCVVIALPLIGVLSDQAHGAATTLGLVAQSFGIALALGILGGWAWVPVIRLLADSPRVYPLTLAALMFLYVFTGEAGGSPAMAVLAFAVIVGNARLLMHWLIRARPEGPETSLADSVRSVHSQISFIIKSLFFTYLGLMLSPPWSLLIMGVALGLILMLVRIPAVNLTLREPTYSLDERGTAQVAMPRGMAAGALATMPALAGVPGTEALHSLVFATIAATIVLFTIGYRKAHGAWPPTRPFLVSGTGSPRALEVSAADPSPDEVTATIASELDVIESDEPYAPPGPGAGAGPA